MRYFFGCIVVLLAYSACSTPQQTIQQPEVIEPISPAEESQVPTWYTEGVHFSSDSLALHGYALASATDSSNAVELSTQNAIDYLRFEIDRTVEQVRKNLADESGESSYSSPSFIILLRNAVSDLSLRSASFTHKHHVSDGGVHYSYSRASLPQNALHDLLEKRLEDDQFIENLRSLPL